MPTRKIKDAELDGEKIYFASHAKATYMSDGRTVEDAISEIQNDGAGNGGLLMKMYSHGENDTTMIIEPNTYHQWGEVAELTISLGEPANVDVVNEYMFSFDNISLTPRLTINELMWEYGEYPEFTFLAKNVVRITNKLAKIESYALAEIVLEDYYGDNSDQAKAIELFNLLYNGGYAPGTYDTNGASISVFAYSDLIEGIVSEPVESFFIPVDYDLLKEIGLYTESGKSFYILEDGTITHIGG